MIDVTLGESDDPNVVLKLQAEAWELNIWAPITELARLRDIRNADWNSRRSLQIGVCANASVHWAVNGEQAHILVGQDDETWDLGVTIPLSTVDEIVSEVEQFQPES
ncbi:hypothetical protein [Nonomuraea sediminis]|uniref:hypothetical protein n=1 Tax=Nonomuraea sediminis TaxID=2835864 RepID=UPI001BDC929B|nr:hypothetical protein [Nonomuraea sediminis]